METGGMNQRVTLQRRETAVDENGFESEVWRDYYTCWAYVNGLSGSEFWAAQSVQSEKTVVFTIRFCRRVSSVNPKDFRLVFRGEIYNITHVDMVRYENDTVKIKAMGMGARHEV